ncbi:FAD-dependent oxidoreductase [Eggerthella sinensis]|uniref:FAD-dependent oxidoreductase n=1 Tax=Eggerthella sinensis TaxID=242230 RepID=A0A3N0IU41_9ACTN|nr:FAD-dependent oxidoreductase [Eggerthella sinensis]RDB66773.1 FAD-dependent oxidoreductase [Eggerthella sinensis]RNM40514.1 FAD-dependent oxidoreductase [Eggerthella sinensis]
MADFDAIVVGSGCAGSVAAYELARAGKSVLVVERGTFAGAKNMTGGRIYSHALKEVFPNFEQEAPLERKITHERISMISEDANFTVDFTSEDMKKESQDSYAVLRAPFDQWLAEKAEDAGAEYICGIAVEKLLKDEAGKVCGVCAGQDEITADVVLLCDGVNSLLTEQAVGAKRPPASAIAVGIKQTIELPASVITDRVLANSDDEGAAWLFSGYSTQGTFGGGFMYTNKESVSLGIVAGIEATMNHGKVPVYQMLEDLKAHPAVAPLIRGGKVVEHSGHMVPEGGLNIMPELVGDGVLLAGESAMMCVNLGYQVRGMDYAVAAGQMAGRSAAKALDTGDTTKAGLQGYVAALENSFVLKDLRRFQKVPAFMEGFSRMFDGYPEMVRDMMNAMFVVDGSPVQPMKKSMMPIVKQIGVLNLLKDARGAMKAL